MHLKLYSVCAYRRRTFTGSENVVWVRLPLPNLYKFLKTRTPHVLTDTDLSGQDLARVFCSSQGCERSRDDEGIGIFGGAEGVTRHKSVRKCKLVNKMCGEWNVLMRWACWVLLFNTSSYRCKSRRPGQAVFEQRKGDLSVAGAVWLSALAAQSDVPGLSCDGHATAQQNTQASG